MFPYTGSCGKHRLDLFLPFSAIGIDRNGTRVSCEKILEVIIIDIQAC